MNKTELINNLSKITSLSAKKCEKVLNGLNFLIFDALSKGESVRLAKLGRFYVKSFGQRQLTNPKTKRKFVVESRNMPAFKMSSSLKKSII